MMSNKYRHITLFYSLLFTIIITGNVPGCMCYNVGRHPHRLKRRRTNNNYIATVAQQPGPGFRNAVYYCDNSIRTSTRSLLMAFDSMDIINTLVQNGVGAEDRIPIVVGGVASAIALLLLLLPPSRLINIGDLNSIVTGTYLERNKKRLRCVYKASKDGWSAIAFHDAVDDKGSGIVVARTITGTTFGGYNPNGWRSTDDYYSSSTAFLWCYGSGKKIVKLPTLPGGNCAVFDYATSGPCFGAADLIIGPPQAAIMGGFAGPDAEDISQSAGSLRQCKSSVGATYDFDRAWPIRGTVRLSDVEVYCLTNNSE